MTRVAPEALERFADALTQFFCAVGRPNDPEVVSEAESVARDVRGSQYIAAITEQRPGVAGHGYPAGEPDWDDINRLYLNRLDPFSERSLVLPDWMALPLIRRVVLDSKRAGETEQADESDSDRVDPPDPQSG